MTTPTPQPPVSPTAAQPAAPETAPVSTTRPPGPSRVVVVDDHAMFRTGVKAEIGRAVAVVGEAADAESAIKTLPMLSAPP